MKTQLKNRVLWYDGISEVSAELIPELFLMGVQPEKLLVNEPTDDILLFDTLSDVMLSGNKTDITDPDLSWKIPKKYDSIILPAYMLHRLFEQMPEPSAQRNAYASRLAEEIKEIEKRGIEPLFKALIYVLDTLKKSNTIWGVGRGSSCASLVLYLLGLHKVDPVKFGIPLTEFFHD